MFDYFNGYWNWAAENTAHNNPTSTAIYFYIVSIANQLNWKAEFNLSSTQVMDGCNIANYKTYKKHFDILVENGLIKVVRESKNQYTSHIIALVKFTKALPKQDQSNTEAIPTQDQSTAHIHKTNKTIKTDKTNKENRVFKSIDEIRAISFFPKSPKLNEAFQDFLINRITNKDYPTTLAIKSLIKKIPEIYKNEQEALDGIARSIQGNYKGLFEPSKSTLNKQPQNNVVTRASMGVKMQ